MCSSAVRPLASLMMTNEIKATEIPAFLCVAFTAFTFNIANGISVAFISFVIIKLAMGRTAELHKGHYLLALLLAYYFYAIAGVK